METIFTWVATTSGTGADAPDTQALGCLPKQVDKICTHIQYNVYNQILAFGKIIK